MIGTFVKTPTSHAIEIMGLVGFDFVIVDQEHAPFDRAAMDVACLAARASGIAAIVRVAEATPSAILCALDLGADGIMAPHIDSPEKARALARACRYRSGTRGYSSTTRAGRYGDAKMAEHMADQDARVVCIAMIEDEAALTQLDAIAQVPGIDGLFIGRGDLSAALGAARAAEATRRIAMAARTADLAVMALVSTKEDAAAMRNMGVSAFAISNDQSFMKAAAAQAVKDYRDPAGL
ncbi:aldolase/citrate lyase family protein [Verticiella sediminum]